MQGRSDVDGAAIIYFLFGIFGRDRFCFRERSRGVEGSSAVTMVNGVQVSRFV